MSKKKEYFTILRLHRDDLVSAGIENKVDDEEMERIAHRMGQMIMDAGEYYDFLEAAFDREFTAL